MQGIQTDRIIRRRGVTVVHNEIHFGRRCIVIQIDHRKEYESGDVVTDVLNKIEPEFWHPSMNPHCCGYVELSLAERDMIVSGYESIAGEEITFHDFLNPDGSFGIVPDGYFIGFDTQHGWNWEHPESMRPPYAIKMVKKIAKKLNAIVRKT